MSHPHGAYPDPRLILTQMEIPGHPGLFVIGSYERNVSILAQQIRAINLVLSLESEGRLAVRKKAYPQQREARAPASAPATSPAMPPQDSQSSPATPAQPSESATVHQPHSSGAEVATPANGKPRVAIIGNGVAGKTAAAMLLRCHCHATIIGPSDSARRNPAQGSRRFIHPFISDFPFATAPNGDPGDAGLPVLNWRKGPAADVYEILNNEWDLLLCTEAQKSPDEQRLSCLDTTATTILPAASDGYLIELAGGNVITADLVIMAVGLGALPSDANYWDPATNSNQERASAGSSWLLSGMGDSNITEFITLVFTRQPKKSAYATIIEELVHLFHPVADNPQDEKATTHEDKKARARALIQQCRIIENDCQYLREEEASKELEARYTALFTNHNAACEELCKLRDTLRSTLKDSLPHIILNSRSPTVFSRDTFPLNRLALALTLSCLGSEQFGDGKRISYHSGTAMAGSGHMITAAADDPHARKVVRIDSRWHTCHHYNARRVPPSPLKSIYLMGRELDEYCRDELKPRNGLDQTRHRMWPYHGNLRRIIKFGKGTLNHIGQAVSGVPSPTTPQLPIRHTITFTDKDHNLLSLEMCYIPRFSGRNGAADFPGYWISRFPITESQFDMLQKSPQQILAELPKTNVSWIEALNYCRRFGLSLPTEVQWRAAWQRPSSHQQPRFPWGDFGRQWRSTSQDPRSPFVVSNVHDESAFNAYGGRNGVCPVGSYQDADSPWGTSQQFGNILEWCLGEGRRIEDYFESKHHSADRQSPRLRPLGGVSALDKEVDGSIERWPSFSWAHDETRRPDVGFRVVWMSQPDDTRFPGLDQKTFREFEETQDAWAATGSVREGFLDCYERRITARVKELGKVEVCSEWNFTKLKNSLTSAAGIARPAVTLVLGIANQSQTDGQRTSQAHAYDAFCIDTLIKGLTSLSIEVTLRFACELQNTPPKDKLWAPAKNTVFVFIGSGRINRGTECMLNWYETSLSKRPSITFLRPSGNIVCDGTGHSHFPEHGLVSIVSTGDDSWPIVFSGGVGREGTAAATAALAVLLGFGTDRFRFRVPVRPRLAARAGVVVRASMRKGEEMPFGIVITDAVSDLLPKS